MQVERHSDSLGSWSSNAVYRTVSPRRYLDRPPPTSEYPGPTAGTLPSEWCIGPVAHKSHTSFTKSVQKEVKSLVLNKSSSCSLATAETVETGRLSRNKMTIRKQALVSIPPTCSSTPLPSQSYTLASQLLGAATLTDPQGMWEDSTHSPGEHLTWGTRLAIHPQVDACRAGTAETAWIWGPETQMAAATILHSTWRCHCTGRGTVSGAG